MSRVVRKEGHGRQAEGMQQVHGRLLLLRGVPEAGLGAAQNDALATSCGGQEARVAGSRLGPLPQRARGRSAAEQDLDLRPQTWRSQSYMHACGVM